MKIGLIAIAGVKLQTSRFIDLGITLPQFMNRCRVLAPFPRLALPALAGAPPASVAVGSLPAGRVRPFAAPPRPEPATRPRP